MKLNINDLDISDEKMLQAIESALGDLSLADVIPETLKDAFVQAGLQAMRQEEPNPEPPSKKEVLLSSYLEYALHVILERAMEKNNFRPVLPLVNNLVTNVKNPTTAGFLRSLLLEKFLLHVLFKRIRAPPLMHTKG
ncbi:hypothetical protein OP658_001039 [Cronobacter sakazakii]|nr:hypothetical protein [Cronobacter sakazakii]EIX1761166.1 hypothetical protein [Cronobacter sakazakii]EIX6119061.1 hypothetical protein [Cronobacter sakazakii]EIX6209230.1 hypothetical protein [Cronobacter sakazakii]EKC6979666.1 hypothetical protein [Cronobacter sakazakii]